MKTNHAGFLCEELSEMRVTFILKLFVFTIFLWYNITDFQVL